MKSSFWCLVAGAMAILATASLTGQSWNESLTEPAQTLQPGISVKLAATSSAQAMPHADDQNAWIVTVTNDGSLYLGTREFSYDGLIEQMISHPRLRDQNLYIKADADTHYANVEKALDAGHRVWFGAPVLLTAQGQRELAEPGTRIQPMGLGVRIESRASSASEAKIVVELVGTEKGAPILKINNQRIQWNDFQNALSRHLQTGSNKSVLVRADDFLPFAEVARVIDVCHSEGAEVILDF